jgi:hypothetical protein
VWLGLIHGGAAEIVLNEIQADNQTTVANGGKHPDWVELRNTTAVARDLGGMSLSDDLGVPRKFVFASGTTLAGGGRLVVWCDEATTAPGVHSGFALGAEGGVLTLYSSAATPMVLDEISYGLQIADFSLGRVPDGTGSWQLCQPTPGTSNVGQSLGLQSRLRINEWMASPDSGDDWFEVYNSESLPVLLGGLSLTDSPTTPGLSPVPAYSYIPAAGFQLFWADQKPSKGASHVNFKLAAGGEAIYLYLGATVLDSVSFGLQEAGVSEGRLPDGSTTVVRFRKTQSPLESNWLMLTNLVVNEVLAHTDPPLEDAVEIYNLTTSPVSIGGWYLSNSRTKPQKYRIPNGVTVPAQGYYVFYEYLFNLSASDPNSFTFNSAHGDEVVLSEMVGGVLSGYRVYEKFPATANGTSLGRYVKSDGVDFPVQTARSFGQDNPSSVAQFRLGTGAANPGPAIGPVVVTEIMYHPPDVVSGGVTNDNTIDEFIELQNVSASTVALFDANYPGNTWQLVDGVEFSFPAGVSLSPNEVVLLASFDPATNATALAQFKSKYLVPSGVRVFGRWSGKLDNKSETVDLTQPDPPQLPPHPDAGYVPLIRVDRVKYGDETPWPAGADGSGQSLQRLQPRGYGNDSANWFAAAPTAGWIGGQLSVASIRVQSGQVVLRFFAEAGYSYSVQVRSSLGTGSWTAFKSYSAQGTARWQEVTDTVGAAGASRYYRLVTPAL